MKVFKKSEAKSKEMPRKRFKILDVYVDSTTIAQLLRVIGKKLNSGHKFYIVTPNPEIVLEACKDKELAEIINQADVSIPDGVGLKFANPDLNIIHGRKLMDELLKLAYVAKYSVYLLGGTPRWIDRAVREIANKYPGIKIYGKYGPNLNLEGESDTDLSRKVNKDIVSEMNKLKPEVVFVGFGAPKQEKWIWKNKDKLNVKCLMTVGGAIDYYSGLKKLPPKLMQRLELEWLFRLFVEPWRLLRIFRAVIIFPLRVFVSKYFV